MITMNQNAFLSGGMAAMSVEDVGEESLDEDDEEDSVEVSAAGVSNDNKQQQRQQGLKRKNNLPKVHD